MGFVCLCGSGHLTVVGTPYVVVVRASVKWVAPCACTNQCNSTQPERSQKVSLNFITDFNWIHCWYLYPYPEFHATILSCCVLVADEINSVFSSSRNLWSTLISFGRQGAWWIKDDVHIISGLNILVYWLLCVFVSLLLPGFQACVYVEGGGGSAYSNASKPCPFGWCSGLLKLYFFLLL